MADCKELKLDFTLKELTLSSQSEDVPGSSSTVELRDNKLVCVEYPAVVTSVDKMLETLGGEQAVSKVSRHSWDRPLLHSYRAPAFNSKRYTLGALIQSSIPFTNVV